MKVFLPPTSYEYATVHKVQAAEVTTASDVLAVEEPLEIRVGYGASGQREHRTLSITMRTPGHDFELAAGFLLTEGIIRNRQELHGVIYCPDVEKEEERENVVRAELAPTATPDLPRLERHFYTSSSCGVCGKTSIEAVNAATCPVLPTDGPYVSSALIHELPARQRAAQALFEQTGGLHAAALFSPTGELLLLREDVGRHNALDKVIGAALLQEWLPLHQHMVLVSGRASFELVQKAAVAGIPILAAVGAPSSLAVSAARSFGMTVCGFVRQNRYNVYCHEWRLQDLQPSAPDSE
ncbi:formate dehydrogenase accessory sulfurtransferase FdhD [Hymenobacter sp. BT186]|uniref:Sulfur carrier protein FdhD n=1 Tax=Hymenobacter telluris TaxID=2816474 RepID=A0A939EYF0_9BACT|nr:formate dehydrogenase accessory sulfurtransferase FdhD [Hymenobacter telluris]MBO0359805.1 formate dehydrogenase accessory sulfurtransferase FdhD [Hymenobacter telluris]MBW3375832.1 formate dehydrogenase accessory sulfurtransferase FdhD [Hymenobacter norwichensis]